MHPYPGRIIHSRYSLYKGDLIETRLIQEILYTLFKWLNMFVGLETYIFLTEKSLFNFAMQDIFNELF